MTRPLQTPDRLEAIQGGMGAAPPLVRVALQQPALLHRNEDSHRPVITLDEEPLARRSGIQDGAERPAEVERADRSHS